MSKSKKIRRFLKKARKGDALCSYLIGCFYEKTVKNYPIALYWYSLAADDGYPEAIAKLKEYNLEDNDLSQTDS